MSRVYPFSVGEAQSAQFVVTVDGEPAPLHIARVSAVPFNRRWPGHQRPVEQTELAAFALFETDSPAEISVKPVKAFREVTVKPLSKSIVPTVSDGVIRFTIPGPGFYTVELDGYHNALHLFADPVGRYDVDPNAGNVLYYGKGVHDVGYIELRSGQTLFIDEGAVVFARVRAVDAENIRIVGRGILDGSRNVEKILFEFGEKEIEQFNRGFAVTNAERSHTVELEYCDNVEIDGITIRDSLVYTIRPICCRGLRIGDVKIIGNWRYNSDGIDMHNCEDVVIRGCFVRTCDDSICIKGFDYTQKEEDMLHGGYLYDVFSDVLVEDCVVWCDWGRSLEFGAETRVREIRNVTFRNCDLIRCSAVALDIQNVDYADIHDVLFENIRVEYDKISLPLLLQNSDSEVYPEDPQSTYMPGLIGSYISYHPEYSRDAVRRGVNRDITFRDIYVTAPRMPHSGLSGFDDAHGTRGVTFDGIYLNGRRMQSPKEANIRIGNFVSDVEFR